MRFKKPSEDKEPRSEISYPGAFLRVTRRQTGRWVMLYRQNLFSVFALLGLLQACPAHRRCYREHGFRTDVADLGPGSHCPA
jgi:hypothetical protein